MQTVLVYQANLGRRIPFKAEVLEERHGRIYLKWFLAGTQKAPIYHKQWVNRGCCSATITTTKTTTKTKPKIKRTKPRSKLTKPAKLIF